LLPFARQQAFDNKDSVAFGRLKQIGCLLSLAQPCRQDDAINCAAASRRQSNMQRVGEFEAIARQAANRDPNILVRH
jgi:hypothetical protein